MTEPHSTHTVTEILSVEDPSEDAIAYTYLRLRPMLVQLLVRLNGWAQKDAEETAHDTIALLLVDKRQNLPRPFPSRHHFLGYCVTTALRNLWRRQKTQKCVTGSQPVDIESTVASPGSEIIRKEDYAEMERKLALILESLTDIQRQIFVMRVEQRPIHAIAVATGLTFSQVNSEVKKLNRLFPGLPDLNPRGRKAATPELGSGTFIAGIISAIINGHTEVGECPRGGDHEWTEESGSRFCLKCLNPADN